GARGEGRVMNDGQNAYDAPIESAGNSSPLAHRSSSLARVGRLARKELREILRDRRTIITLIAMPVLLYPLMSVLFVQFSLANRELSRPTLKYRLAVMSAAEADVLRERLDLGKQALKRSRAKQAHETGKKEKTPTLPDIDILR